MLLVVTNIIIFVFAALVFWWVSGFDVKLTGENKTQNRFRRSLRCGMGLLLVEGAFAGLLWNSDPANGSTSLAVLFPLVLIWCGFFLIVWRDCLGEIFTHGFNHLIDSEDDREFDPKKSLRDLDAIASLIKNGHKEAAIQLCNELKASSDASVLAMETMLEHLGVPQSGSKIHRPLAEASALRRQGKFGEAELLLNSLLMKNPRDLDAAMMLTRLYAQDLRQPAKAEEVLRALEQQPHISMAHIDFARRSIPEWSREKPAPDEVPVQPKSFDELLAQGYFGTAVEILEQKTAEQPQDFDLSLKLAETHALHCGNMNRAEKIVRGIETNPAFSPEQIQAARAKLKEWREAGVR